MKNRERGPGGALKTCRERGRITGWEVTGDNGDSKMVILCFTKVKINVILAMQ